LTGIDGVIPDPYYVGGGLHQIKPGGNLEVHVDFNRHSKFKLDRRINLLIYLNKNWKEEYGGHFELWNRDMSAAEQKILPVFNRCAIFSTTEFSYHGHPTPLACPSDRTRKSMATYYYSNGRPEEEISSEHTTLFQSRPGQEAEKEHVSMKEVLKAFTPPILISAVKKLKK
jgi:Rps23 Pro-64 3,4-dihydroxylase Tpa1-like proline 4-hydroxylase